MLSRLHTLSLPLPAKWAQRGIYSLCVFFSAALIFLVEPMVAKMLLPNMGGAPAVWNTSLAFFQIALLIGYLYAHFLQKIPRFRTQILIHLTLLVLASLTLPLHLSDGMGPPDPQNPILWILGVLCLTLGAPFALLSATAPLLQAWFSKTSLADPSTGKAPEPYALYAASNLGSLIALMTYPLVFEPFMALGVQQILWSGFFLVFIICIVILGVSQKEQTDQMTSAISDKAQPVPLPSLRTMAIWTLLAAAPSSLMMGVTNYLSTDVATAPLLWVIPLALYLITFIIAFQTNPSISPKTSQLWQVPAAAFVLMIMAIGSGPLIPKVILHLLAFFLTALVCHQTLSSRRPGVEHLTIFYLSMSFGGVIGGAFNAFLAPIILNDVYEYPLVLVLALLARPWQRDLPDRPDNLKTLGLTRKEGLFLMGGVLTLAGLVALMVFLPLTISRQGVQWGFMALAAILLISFRQSTLVVACLAALMAISGHQFADVGKDLAKERSFFGVVRVYDIPDPELGSIRLMAHGTTLHGGQSTNPVHMCQPLTYYAPETGIGQSVRMTQSRLEVANIGLVGLGTGALATYGRAEDQFTFYEIDPLVIRFARDPKLFTYLSDCSKARMEFVLGDARFQLQNAPDQSYDLLVIDAFSSDSVPAHLMTREAIALYLSKIKPDGAVLFHLSNRYLELRDPVMKAVAELDGLALTQVRRIKRKSPYVASSTITVIATKSQKGMDPFRADPRWRGRDISQKHSWRDDHTNLIGTLRFSTPQE